MDISRIDENFAADKFYDDGDMRFYNIPCESFDLYGVFYEKETERFVRMPSKIADSVRESVGILNAHTAGGRIRFSTDASKFSIKVKYGTLFEMSHMPLSGSAGFVLLEETEAGVKHVETFFPPCSTYDNNAEKGFSSSCDLCGEKKNYILFFPLYNDVKNLVVGLNKDAFVSHGKKYKEFKPILYYGSSITQGGCASRPDNAYQAFISKWSNTDFINLGFSGAARAEDIMCDYLAGIDCSVFICDYDYNAPDPEYLNKTHYALYKTFREKQPDTPVVFISHPYTGHNGTVKERFEVIKNTFEKARAAGDKRVFLIDGRTFFAGECREESTVDGTHPNDLGFYKMATVIYGKIKEILGENDR